jgi:hypothetical protein
MNYKQIACIPISIDKMFESEILFNFITNCEYQIGKVLVDDLYVEWSRKEVCLFYTEVQKEISTNWKESATQPESLPDDVKSETKRLKDFIENQLPIKLTFLSIIKSKGELPAHFDVTENNLSSETIKNQPEPSLLKILLRPQYSINKLYFTDKDGKNKIFFTNDNFVIDTNLYAWSRKTQMHGVHDLTKDTDRIIINIYGTFDNDAYYKLIDLSYQKYETNTILINDY